MDVSILETELTALRSKLEKDLHMNHVRRLSKNIKYLKKYAIQRKQIDILTKELSELQPTVSTVYSRRHSINDNEITDYLIYLLKMKDHFSREVATKQEMITERDLQIKKFGRKLRRATNEKAKEMKTVSEKSLEFVRLDNLSNEIQEMNKKLCTLRHKNKEIMENINNMRKFQRQYKKFEKDFRGKIKYLKKDAQNRLTQAVAAYEEIDEFRNKEKVLEHRRIRDLRKAVVTKNSLDLCLQKSEKIEKFSKLQDAIRMDNRLAKTTDMIQKGITGIEPMLEKSRGLRAAISEAAGEETPEEMEVMFKLVDDKTGSMVSYLDELLKDIHRLQAAIDRLKEENRKTMKMLSLSDRKMMKQIEIKQDEAQIKLKEAEEKINEKDEVRKEMDFLLDCVKGLYGKIFPNDKDTLSEKPVDDSNVLEYLLNMEQQLLEYLICAEYIKLKEVSEEERPPIVLETEEDEDVEDTSTKQVHLTTLQPHILQSGETLQLHVDLDGATTIYGSDQLNEIILKEISQTESEKNDNEFVSGSEKE